MHLQPVQQGDGLDGELLGEQALADTAARTWEPKRLRLRLLSVAGRVVRTARRRLLRLPRDWPWSDVILAGHYRLAALSP